MPKLRYIQPLAHRLLMIALLLLAAGTMLHAQDKKEGEKPAAVPMQSVKPVAAEAANEVIIQGVIRDSQGETLPGANVRIRETKGGAVADANGEFTIGVQRGKSVTVEFSFVGMKTLVKQDRKSVV